MESVLSDSRLKFVFVSGKGGVGKTTTSSALALVLAQRRRVLLISTDPAHSLGDAFNRAFPRGVHTTVCATAEGALDVLEVNPREYIEEEMKVWSELAEQSGMAEAEENMKGLQEWLVQAPGIDEATAISTVMSRIAENAYDLVVFDTAPTGHTLKLLQMPELLRTALAQLKSWQGSIWAYWSTIKQISNGSSEASMAAQKKIEMRFEEYSLSMEKVAQMVRDKVTTVFIAVCIAEHLSVQETKRMLAELAEKEIRVGVLVVNMLFPRIDGDGPAERLVKSRRQIQDKYLSVLHSFKLPVVEVPLQAEEVTGQDELRRFATLLGECEVAFRAPAGTGESVCAPPGDQELAINTTVELVALSKKEYNGLLGVIKSFDTATERYAVRVDLEGKTKSLALRRDNIAPRNDLLEDEEIQSYLDNPKVFDAYQSVLKKPSAIRELLDDSEMGNIIRKTAEKLKPIH